MAKDYTPFMWRALASGINMGGSAYTIAKDQGKTDLTSLAAANLTASTIYFTTNLYEAGKEYLKKPEETFEQAEARRRLAIQELV